VEPGPALSLHADGDQLEQALINLVRNAVEATLARAAGGQVRLTWGAAGDAVEVRVQDDGPGLPPSQNLFVPFFTTRPGGSGVGLVLARQIAEAHDGTLSLAPRPDGALGCLAVLRLPLAPSGAEGPNASKGPA
jgi:signal transduction histidine kinase